MIYRFFLLVWHVGKMVIAWIGERMVWCARLENPRLQDTGFCANGSKISE